MATFQITDTEGRKFEVNAPDDITQEQLLNDLQEQGIDVGRQQTQQTQQQEPTTDVIEQMLQQQSPLIAGAVKAEEKTREFFDVVGEKVAESLAGSGLKIEPVTIKGARTGLFSFAPAEPGEDNAIKTSPEIAAGIGTTIQMFPDIAESAAGGFAGKKVAKAGVQAAKKSTIGKALRNTGEKEVRDLIEQQARIKSQQVRQTGALRTAQEEIGRRLTQRQQQLSEPVEKGIRQIREQIRQLPIHQQRAIQTANDEMLASKAAIAEAERNLGVGIGKVGSGKFKQLVNNSKKVEKFVDQYSKISNNIGEEKLARYVDDETLQTVRKAAESAAKNTSDDFMKAELRNIEKTYRNALARSSKELDQAFSRFKAVSKKIDSLPKEFEQKKNVLKLGLQRLQNLVKQRQLNDTEVKKLQKTLDILERHSRTLPRRFSNQKAQIDVVLEEARTLAAKQSVIRKWTIGLAGIAIVGAAFSTGQKFVPGD